MTPNNSEKDKYPIDASFSNAVNSFSTKLKVNQYQIPYVIKNIQF